MIIEMDNRRSKINLETHERNGKIDYYKELRNYLKAKQKNYHRTDSFRKGKWGGDVYFITENMTFNTGYMPFVISFLKELGAAIEIIDLRWRKYAEDLLHGEYNFNLPNGHVLREHQQEGVKRVLNKYIEDSYGNKFYFPRGYIDAATNAGKTYMMAGLYNTLKSPKILFLVHRATLFKQTVEFFEQFGKVGKVDLKNTEFESFTVAMTKTLANRAERLLNVRKALGNFNVLIVDESHTAGTKTHQKLIRWINAPMRLMISGTHLENDDTVRNMKVIGLSGPKLYEVKNIEMIEKGFSLKPTVYVYHNDDLEAHVDYAMEYRNMIMRSNVRLDIISQAIKERPGKYGLIPVIKKDHGFFLVKHLREDFPDKKIEFIYADHPRVAEIIEATTQKMVDVLICTDILKEGVNIPILNYLIMAAGGKSPIFVKQYIGRVLREDGENTECDIIDFYDDGNYVSKHSRNRLNIYKKEGFEIKTMYKQKYNKPENALF